ncbi:MAG TPA: hypothetical protein VEN78_18605 [Bradyrhizobium sp.]|nr:hypothetical protein [Bradyrhizobium sp.]
MIDQQTGPDQIAGSKDAAIGQRDLQDGAFHGNRCDRRRGPVGLVTGPRRSGNRRRHDSQDRQGAVQPERRPHHALGRQWP